MAVDAKDLMMAGQLIEARAQLTAEVKAAPTDVRKRTLLFQVLALLNEWEKAEKHLDMIANLDVRSGTGVQAYRNAINAEKERREVAGRKRLPGFVSEAPVYLDTYLAAWDALMEKKIDEATTLYEKVERQRAEVSGTMKGKDFIGFSDTDAFLSGFLEAFVHDRYIWIPFESLAELSIDPPGSFLDLLWAPARAATWEGMSVQCYLPVSYHDPSSTDDQGTKLGRMTDWRPLGGSYYRGVGQHVFTAGDEEISLLELGEVAFRVNRKKERT